MSYYNSEEDEDNKETEEQEEPEVEEKETYYKVTETYSDDDGNEYEVNEVIYERSDGSGIDYVEQTKCNGVEIGHHTEHPDGTVHDYGCYAEGEDDDDDDDDNQKNNNNNNYDDEEEPSR